MKSLRTNTQIESKFIYRETGEPIPHYCEMPEEPKLEALDQQRAVTHKELKDLALLMDEGTGWYRVPGWDLDLLGGGIGDEIPDEKIAAFAGQNVQNIFSLSETLPIGQAYAQVEIDGKAQFLVLKSEPNDWPSFLGASDSEALLKHFAASSTLLDDFVAGLDFFLVKPSTGELYPATDRVDYEARVKAGNQAITDRNNSLVERHLENRSEAFARLRSEYHEAQRSFIANAINQTLSENTGLNYFSVETREQNNGVPSAMVLNVPTYGDRSIPANFTLSGFDYEQASDEEIASQCGDGIPTEFEIPEVRYSNDVYNELQTGWDLVVSDGELYLEQAGARELFTQAAFKEVLVKHNLNASVEKLSSILPYDMFVVLMDGKIFLRDSYGSRPIDITPRFLERVDLSRDSFGDYDKRISLEINPKYGGMNFGPEDSFVAEVNGDGDRYAPLGRGIEDMYMNYGPGESEWTEEQRQVMELAETKMREARSEILETLRQNYGITSLNQDVIVDGTRYKAYYHPELRDGGIFAVRYLRFDNGYGTGPYEAEYGDDHETSPYFILRSEAGDFIYANAAGNVSLIKEGDEISLGIKQNLDYEREAYKKLKAGVSKAFNELESGKTKTGELLRMIGPRRLDNLGRVSFAEIAALQPNTLITTTGTKINIRSGGNNSEILLQIEDPGLIMVTLEPQIDDGERLRVQFLHEGEIVEGTLVKMFEGKTLVRALDETQIDAIVNDLEFGD